MKRKFHPDVYWALKDRGHNNVQIAELLGVSEAAVRRGLVGYMSPEERDEEDGVLRFLVTVRPA